MPRATFAGLTTAFSALQANQKRLDITGQNLANMNTTGYTRQQLQTSSLNYSNPINYYMNGAQVMVGFGTRMDKVTQIRDPFLDGQYRAQMTKAGYTDAMQTSLDSLSKVLDETSISGIRQAFDNIQSTLTMMQSSSNASDAIYESELRSRMEALTNLLNDSSRQIESRKQDELSRLDGTGTDENGAQQQVNDLLRQIGDLNHTIKQNQILGQPSLELQDKRNVLLDTLASYIPIEVTYYKDKDHSGIVKDGNGNTVLDANGKPREKIYDYDAKGNILGKKEWPNDLKVELVYTKPDGTADRLTLVNGTDSPKGANYGKMEVQNPTPNDLSKVSVKLTGTPTGTTPGTSVEAAAGKAQFSGGSVQTSLDMLGKDGNTYPDVRGYQYYTDQLDLLADAFAYTINTVNINGGSGNLLVNKTPANAAQPTVGITAANIGISEDWLNGTVHIGSGKAGSTNTITDTISDMLKEMQKSQTALGDKKFANFMNNVSTILANDSSNNTNALKTNVTVLNGVQSSRDSMSGVSMDEEAANMMTYLSAYNAASRLMTALDEALNTLISSTGLVGR